FEMGDHFNEGKPHELPLHTVKLNAFYMDRTEITVGHFRQFVNHSGYNYPGDWAKVAQYSPTDDHPMIYVNWHDATAYADWAGKRLPTEAEWEYAARGGLAARRYPWGNQITHDNANYQGTAGKDQWDQSTAPVGGLQAGSFAPNGYGLYDMAGNVWEWCADRYDEDYYSQASAKNPSGPGSGSGRLLRGGAWSNGVSLLRLA
ncbi:MAG: SUMF1/EgtB/PvdO family nonheme iron enzyme, partial [Gammaproteobacteria bacterium]|nr:SUMF1/EgtB/PvdO family nonheme iron enzyme [Gammaproteobacteria bacterium]